MYNVSSFSSQGGVSDRNNPLPWFSVLRFGEGRLCSDVPSTAAAVQCFGAAFPPRLQTEQQGTMFTFHPLKIILESWVIQQIKNSHHGRGERIFVSSLLPSMWIRSHLCPSSAPSTLCAVLPLEDLVEDFMRGSGCDFSPGCGAAHRKWCSPVASFLSVYSLACAHSCKKLTLFLAASSKALIQPIPTLVRLVVDMEWIMTWNNLHFQWNKNFLLSLAHM